MLNLVLATAVIANTLDWFGDKLPHSTPNFTIDGGSVGRQIDIAHTLKDLKTVDTFKGWTMILIGHRIHIVPSSNHADIVRRSMALSRFWKLSQAVALKFPLRPTEFLVLLQLLSDLNGRFLSVSSLISMQHACVITHYYTLGVRERSVQTQPPRCLERKSPFSRL